MAGFAIGVDLGGTNMRVAAVDERAVALEILSTTTELRQGREHVLRQMAGVIRDLSRRHGGSRQLLGVGVGVPGIIDLEHGTVLSATNLPGWSSYPVKADLQALLGAPVLLENDANCAALGEKWAGAGQAVDDLCMLTLGTGVGGGLVVKGRPWHGVMGMAGELGHMTVLPDGFPCPCGSRGCLEQYASATAIRRMALAAKQDAAKQGTAPSLAKLAEIDPQFTARAVFECAQQGDPAAQAIFDQVGSALGIALANLINALNLPLYVIGGGVAGAWEAFRPAMLRELQCRSIVFRAGEPLRAQHRGTTITRSLLDESAGLFGAARLPMLLATPNCCSVAG
jgi:glucokinase